MPKRVFISYSWDSKSHADAVLKLANSLCGDGLDCTIDQYIESPEEGWPGWMLRQIDESDFVLIVNTAIYNRRSRGEVIAKKGLGSRWESLIAMQMFYEAGAKTAKFIPIVFGSGDLDNIIEPLRAFTRYDLSSPEGYGLLVRRLTSQPKIIKPIISPVKEIPSAIGGQEDLTGGSPLRDMGGAVAIASDVGVDGIELRINRDFDSFSGEEQKRLLNAISLLLGIEGEIRVKSKKRGSVLLGLDLPPELAELLMRAVEQGKLDEYGVTAATLIYRSKFELPELGYSESFYVKKALRAEREGNLFGVHSAKVGQYVTLAMDDKLTWQEKLRYLKHTLYKHCVPPRLVDDVAWGFYKNLINLVKDAAGQEALRIASREDDFLAKLSQSEQTRKLVRDRAKSFFDQMIPNEECPDWFHETDFAQLRMIRDSWMDEVGE